MTPGALTDAIQQAKEDGHCAAIAALWRSDYRPSEKEFDALEDLALGDGTSKPETAKRIKHLARALNHYRDLKRETFCDEGTWRTRTVAERAQIVAERFDLLMSSVMYCIVEAKDRRVNKMADELRLRSNSPNNF